MNNTVQLHDPAIYPNEDVLKSLFRKAFSVYQAVLDLYTSNNLTYEWRFYNDAKIWLCKVQFKKRTIVWMSAWDGYIQATIYFPERYINGIYGLNISKELIESIKKTKKSGKSKPCIFKLTSKKDLIDFNTIMQFKLIAK